MFQGIRSKHKKEPSLRASYTIHVIEIRPWPPSESLRSLPAVLLQWESGTHHSGTFLSASIDSKIVFNESFKLPLVLYQDKNKNHENKLEFTLYSSHNNKSKGHLLGTAIFNLPDHGAIEHVISIDALVNFKKGISSSYNSIQPVLVILVEPVEEGGSGIACFKDEDIDCLRNEVATSLSSRIQKIYERSLTSVKKRSDNPYLRSYSLTSRRQDMFTKPDAFAEDIIRKSPDHEVIPYSKRMITENTQQPMTSGRKKSVNPYVRSYSLTTRNRDMFTKPTTLSEEIVRKSSDHEVIPNSKHITTENTREHVESKPLDIKEVRGEISDSEREWRSRVEMLEEELRETAAIELGLYSVVAEHVHSVNKVHVAARRLSRFYSDACKSGSKAKRASAARAAVRGLVVVSKSCGNDVARLTFWLSNSIMLRTTVIQIASELPNSSNESDDVSTFIAALEKIESWLFSRIVESVWWQTFTPHMHLEVPEELEVTPVSSTKKSYSRSNSFVYGGQGKFSTELWKKTFKDVCKSLCPIRAGGHECGCLTLLVRLLMEQLVDRLDTAMFNAILRESAEEMPTDPVSDPITEPKVLPILAGKSSFGAGAELKSSIGTWSRCLADIFGLEDETRENGNGPKSFKVFRLLDALSDLMMLPFGMLADVSTRREVCPMLGPTVMKRVLNNHVPDEFCPDPIPQDIIESLNTEEVSVLEDDSGDIVMSLPCMASPMVYTPPSAAELRCVGDAGNQMLKKSCTSDDELDELDSPFTTIIPDSFQSSALAKLSSMPKEEGGKSITRYQLLREIWRDDE